MAKRGKEFNKAKRRGYTNSTGVCAVVHDLGGRPVTDKVTAEIENAVTTIAVKYGYVVNFTRQ